MSGNKSKLRKIISVIIFWGSMAVMGIFAIPAGILFGMIYSIWKVSDFLIRRLEKE